MPRYTDSQLLHCKKKKISIDLSDLNFSTGGFWIWQVSGDYGWLALSPWWYHCAFQLTRLDLKVTCMFMQERTSRGSSFTRKNTVMSIQIWFKGTDQKEQHMLMCRTNVVELQTLWDVLLKKLKQIDWCPSHVIMLNMVSYYSWLAYLSIDTV